jgi:hypothetical protein
MGPGESDVPKAKLAKCMDFAGDKTYICEMAMEWKALVGRKAPGETSHRS